MTGMYTVLSRLSSSIDGGFLVVDTSYDQDEEVRMARKTFCVCCVIALVLATACTSYKRQPVSFKMPSAYPNATEVAGATVAAKAYYDPKEAKEAFGFDIRSAGLYPVQVIFDNLGDYSLAVEPSQTFLVDGQGNLWSIIDSGLAYDRVKDKSELARIGKEGAKTGLYGSAAAALLGAAVGIVSGENVLESAGKGAVLGGAVGATVGGASAATSGENARAAIARDLREKSLENKAVPPHSIAHGFIFFPGEAEGAGELRLQLRVVETGSVMTIRLAL
jgi:hypothetical protein